VWLNAAPARPLAEALAQLLDLLIVNRVEADACTGLAARVPMLITRGAEGVEHAGRRWPAQPVEVISTHGAGDMFAGALAARASQGASIEASLAYAQAAAAWHVSTAPAERETVTPATLAALLAPHARP
jgi:ribokinase